MSASLLLRQLVIFFLYMGAGALLVGSKVMKAEDSRILSLLVVYLLLPCGILRSFQAEYSPAIRSGFVLALFAALASQVFMIAITYGVSAFLKLTPVEKASIMYPNTANLILPLVAGVLGDKYVIYASAFPCIQGIFLWTHCASMMRGFDGFRNLDWKKVFINLNLITVIAGIAMFFGQVHLPPLVVDTLSGFSSALGPVSMIVIGMVLTSVDWRGIFSNRRVYLVTALRMVILPLILGIAFKYTPIREMAPDGEMILMVTMFAVMAPTATLITQLAQIDHQDDRYAAAINALTTVICIATMPLLTIWYLH